MQDPSVSTTYRFWISEVGGAFGGIDSWVATGLPAPLEPRQWAIWPYGNLANKSSPVRLSAAAVAGWDTSWDEATNKYFEDMHDKVS